MVDAARAMLDELMGVNRNGDRPGAAITDFQDPRVCRDFLCGMCPHDLFTNTKVDLGPCDRVHDEKLRTAYERARKERDFGYERQHLRTLERCIAESDRRIERSRKRVDEEDVPVINVEGSKEVVEISNKIKELLKRAEELGEEGDVDQSLELTAEAEALVKQKAEAQARAMLNPVHDGQVVSTVNQKLRLCDVCGAFLSIFDSDSRLADHFEGKSHQGYLLMRKRLQEMREKYGAAPDDARYSAAPPVGAQAGAAEPSLHGRADSTSARQPSVSSRSRHRSRSRDHGGRDDRAVRRSRSRDRASRSRYDRDRRSDYRDRRGSDRHHDGHRYSDRYGDRDADRDYRRDRSRH